MTTTTTTTTATLVKTSVQPQWTRGNNPESKTIEHRGFTPQDWQTLTSEERAFACGLIDKQTFIKAGSRWACQAIKEQLVADGHVQGEDDKDETAEDFAARLASEAKEVWKTLKMPGSTLELLRWACENARKSGEGNAKLEKAKAEARAEAMAENARKLATILGCSVEDAIAKLASVE